MNKFLLHSLFLTSLLGLTSCEGLKLAFQKKKPARYEVVGNKAYLKGTLGHKGYKNTVKMISENPQVSYIVLDDIPGCVNDYYNQQTCYLIKEKNIQTIALAGAQISDGGSDFLFSGLNPLVSDSSYVGVSGWKTRGKEAVELDKKHEDHKFFTKFYDSININSDLYWYTLDKASSDEIYWMPYKDITNMNLAKVTPDKEIKDFLKQKTPLVVLVGLKSYESRYKILVDHGETENAENLKLETELTNKELISSFEQNYTETKHYYFYMHDLDKIQSKDFSVLIDEEGEELNMVRDANTIYLLADLSSTDGMNLPSLMLRYENYQMTPRYERTMGSVKMMEKKLDKVVENFNKDVREMIKHLKLN